MKKLLMIISLCSITSFIVGCTEPNTSIPASISSANYALTQTPGLEGCVLYKFEERLGTSNPLRIVRCDARETITTNTEVPSGKTTDIETTVIINGETYTKKEK